MAQLTLLMAGLLFLVESQASDVADRSRLQGFLSKYKPSGSDAPRSSKSGYDKFITPNLNHVKHENGAEALSNRNNLAEPGPNREDMQAVQKLATNDSSKPITLSAIGIGLLSLATVLGVRLQRRLQPATILASSGGLGPLMPMNTASALGDNVMEMQSQDPNINDGAAVLETRSEHKIESKRVGWGQLLSQNSRPLALTTRFAFFDQFIPNPEADAELDGYVSSAKAVLLTDGGAGGETVKAALKGQKLSQYTEVNLGSKPNKGPLLGSLKRRVGVDAPVLIVAGQVFDKKRIEYLCDQDMMLPVFRSAGTSGEVRLPFQDLRFYLSKTIR